MREKKRNPLAMGKATGATLNKNEAELLLCAGRGFIYISVIQKRVARKGAGLNVMLTMMMIIIKYTAPQRTKD